jgi:hypothetical protein
MFEDFPARHFSARLSASRKMGAEKWRDFSYDFGWLSA